MKMERRGAIFLALFPAAVVGHGMLTYPPTRFPNAGPGFTGMFPFGSSFCKSPAVMGPSERAVGQGRDA